MALSRLFLVVSAVLFIVAAVLASGVVKGVSVEGVALVAFAFWAGSGAV